MSHAVRGGLPTGSDPGAVAGLVTMLTLGTAFTLLTLGVEWFWVVFPVGFGGVMPVAVGAAKRKRDRRGHRAGDGRRRGSDARNHERRRRGDDAAGTDAALARLRERYAAGELDEADFEDRLERLLLTEDASAAREHATAGGGAEGRSGRPSTDRD